MLKKSGKKPVWRAPDSGFVWVRLVDSMATGGDFPNRPCRHSIGVPPGKAVIPSTQAIGPLT
jgi:hypothetical protein